MCKLFSPASDQSQLTQLKSPSTSTYSTQVRKAKSPFRTLPLYLKKKKKTQTKHNRLFCSLVWLLLSSFWLFAHVSPAIGLVRQSANIAAVFSRGFCEEFRRLSTGFHGSVLRQPTRAGIRTQKQKFHHVEFLKTQRTRTWTTWTTIALKQRSGLPWCGARYHVQSMTPFPSCDRSTFHGFQQHNRVSITGSGHTPTTAIILATHYYCHFKSIGVPYSLFRPLLRIFLWT